MRGRPGRRRCEEPSNLAATSWRYQPRMVSGFGDAGDLLQQFAAQTFADFGERGSLGTGEPEAWLQMGFQNTVLSQQVLILQKQFLVDETGHIGQKTGDRGDVWLQSPS